MPTETGATDINGAAKRLSSLLKSEQSLPTDTKKPEEHEAQAEDQEDMTGTEATDQETPEGDTEEQEQKYKVKVDGEELEVTLDELQKSYMMEADYRRKTMALGKERDTIEAKQLEIDKQLEDARLILEEEVAALESEEMKELKSYDPEEYIKRSEKINQKVKKFQALKEKRAEEQRKRQESFIAKEREALLVAFPEWKDQSVMAKDSQNLFKVMRDLGFTDAELANVTDHRMFVLANKALQLDKINQANIEAKKAKAKPKSMKPGVPGTKEDRENAEAKKLRERLKQSGNLRDAARLLTL